MFNDLTCYFESSHTDEDDNDGDGDGREEFALI